MLSMTKLRQHSKKIYILLLLFFVASLVLGGLMGGADLFGIWSANSKANNAGQIGEELITDQNYSFIVSNQLTALRLQNGTISAQDSVNVYNGVWNTLVQHELEKRKANELGIITPKAEIYKLLRDNPPQNFRKIFVSAGAFTDENGAFSLEDYQKALDSKKMPDEFKSYFDQWGPIVDRYTLRPRILENIYRRISTVSDEEIKFEYLKKNTNCNIDYMFIKTTDIEEDLITVSDQEIKNEYNKIKSDKYKVPNRRAINYISIRLTDSRDFNLTDSLTEQAYSFIDEADLTSFKLAAEKFDYKINSLDIHEGFDNNSGFPFLMGPSRAAVRFIFDNELGSISEPVKMNNEIIVFEIDTEKTEGYKSFDKVKGSIQKTLIENKKKEYAADILNKVNWDDTNNNTEINILQNQEGIISGRFEEIGTSGELVGTLLGLEPGKTSQIINTYNTVCKVKINSRDSFDQAKYDETYLELKNQLTSAKNSTNYQAWLNSAKENSDIKDYRSEKY